MSRSPGFPLPENLVELSRDVSKAVRDAFDAAKGLMVNGKLCFLNRSHEPSHVEVHEALGFSENLLCQWRRGNLSLTRQRLWTGRLLDTFLGEDVFDDPEIKMLAKLCLDKIYSTGQGTALHEAIVGLQEYQLVLDKIVSSAKRGHVHASLARTHPKTDQNSSNPNIYEGSQGNDSTQTASIFHALAAGQVGGQLGTVGGFEFELPRYFVSSADLQLKISLYGGIPVADFKLLALDFALLRMTFERTASETLAKTVIDSKAAFTSHTIYSRAGQGKSIALAQILVRLCNSQGIWTFWSIDNKQPLQIDERLAEACVRRVSSSGYKPKRVVFIIDDFFWRTAEERTRLLKCQSWCQAHAAELGVPVSFLYSTANKDVSISEPATTLRLHLTAEDERKLYDAVTAESPVLAGRKYDTLDEMFAYFPTDKRHLRDDVQSFSDYVIRHSKHLRETKSNWFSDLDEELPIARRALPIIAVSQLLDLALPEHIAHSMLPSTVAPTANLARLSKRINLIAADTEHPWQGYVLSSPWYARSLLTREEKLNEAFINETLVEIVRHSLARADADFDLWLATDAEFVRHIFQRLGKQLFNWLGGLADAGVIAGDLLFACADISRMLSEQAAPATCAKWAGTLSYLLPQTKPGYFSSEQDALEKIVFRLCEDVFKKKGVVSDPAVFVSLMRAVSTICDQYRHEDSIQAFVKEAEDKFDFRSNLDAALLESNRRANEVLLSYVQFVEAHPDHSKKYRLRNAEAVYFELETASELSRRLSFDVRNWIERARIASEGTKVTLAAAHFNRAREVTLQNSDEAKWRSLLEKKIRKFEKETGHTLGQLLSDTKVTQQ